VSFIQRSSKDGCVNMELEKPHMWVTASCLGFWQAVFLSCCFCVGNERESDF